jgi:hypothetical protein
MTLAEYFNDPDSIIIFICGVIVSTIFIIGVARNTYGKNISHKN